ncbi:MAG TPA: hypothetical protein VND64_04155 [Pirellulales bacterium]|nr:hypothetical protein [Pirellulales bacterium]
MRPHRTGILENGYWGMAFWGVAIVCGLVPTDRAWGDDFHVQSKLFYPDKDEPVSESTTLFYAGRVYDFLSAADETTVFDPQNDEFKLLDSGRKLKTEITTGEIAQKINLLRTAARAQVHLPLAKFYIDPKFTESQNQNGDVLLTSAYLEYKLKTFIPSNPEASRQYCAFADWSVQLDVMLNLKPDSNPSDVLPFARLKVNDVLKQRQELPLEVVKTLKPQKKGKKEVIYRSEHSIQPRLAQEDLRRIKEVHEQLHTFNSVSFDEYRRRKAEQTQNAVADGKGR